MKHHNKSLTFDREGIPMVTITAGLVAFSTGFASLATPWLMGLLYITAPCLLIILVCIALHFTYEEATDKATKIKYSNLSYYQSLLYSRANSLEPEQKATLGLDLKSVYELTDRQANSLLDKVDQLITANNERKEVLAQLNANFHNSSTQLNSYIEEAKGETKNIEDLVKKINAGTLDSLPPEAVGWLERIDRLRKR